MILRGIYSVVLAILIAGQAPAPQDHFVSEARNKERVIGLLALPEIFGEFECPPSTPERLTIYASASSLTPPIGSIELLNPPKQQDECESPNVVVRRSGSNSAEELPSEEKGYENRAAVVYEQSGRWFRIALASGSAWIERKSADGFESYPDSLISDSYLTHLRRGWDGRFWTAPGGATPSSAPAEWRAHLDREIPVRVLASVSVRGEIWIHLRFETEVCGNDLKGVRTFEGWMPSHRPAQQTTVWFHSRGC